jgi:hypothetical protein
MKCFWCDMDGSEESWNAPDAPRPITHAMVHAFIQAFPDIEPTSFGDLEPQDYLGDDVYFSTSEWPIFGAWAVQQGYWTIDALLVQAVAHDQHQKLQRQEMAAFKRTPKPLSEDELPF